MAKREGSVAHNPMFTTRNAELDDILFNPEGFTPMTREQVARSQGWKVQPGGRTATKAHASGAPIVTDMNIFEAATPTAQQQLRQAQKSDIDFFDKNIRIPYQEQTAAFGRAVDTGADEMVAAGMDEATFLGKQRDKLQNPEARTRNDTAAATGEYDKMVEKTAADASEIKAGARRAFSDNMRELSVGLDQSISKMFGQADGAVASAMSAVTSYDASVSNTISSTISGMDRRVQLQMEMLEKGVDPQTGLPMSQEEVQAARLQMQSEVNASMGESAMKLRDSAQQVLAGLRTQLAQVQLGAAGIAGQAGQLRIAGAQAKTDAAASRDRTLLGATELETGARGTAAAGKMQAAAINGDNAAKFAEIRAGYDNLMSGMRNAGRMSAVQLRVQGRGQQADMLARTPMLSMTEGLLSMLALSSAPYGRNLRGAGV